ncbi:alpha/beta hydrolase family protein [Aurantiacibacter xanthus]|nr:alpha/beta fold hydrolase [Aurantiacibacter xanthus]
MAVTSAAPVFAQEADSAELATQFGARPSVLDISLSPTGEKIAYIAPGPGSADVLYLADLSGDGTPRAINYLNNPAMHLSRCDFATEERLICDIEGISTIDGVLAGYSRVVSIAADGSDMRVLTARDSFRALGARQDGGSVIALDAPGKQNSVLMTRQYVPETMTGTRLSNQSSGLGVDAVDVTNGNTQVVERPDRETAAYVADDTGAVRLRIVRPFDNLGRYTGETRYYFRPATGGGWQKFSTDLVSFKPVAVDSAQNIAYAYGKAGDYDAIYEVPLEGAAAPVLLSSREGVDIDQLLRIGRQRRVVGASFATEKRQIVYFDEDLGSLASKLEHALPGNPLITITDASADEQLLLVIASSDTDPGTTYLLDRRTNELSPLLSLREQLDGRDMAPMQPVSFPAADGTMIPAYLTMPLGGEATGKAIVMPHGGPSSRDEWGFDWLVQFFAARGYAVLQPNYRGSSGYGSAWFGHNGFQSWDIAIGDVNDAGRWLLSEGIATPEKLAIVGWSYGGYAALQSQVVAPDLYQAVAAIAPVADLENLVDEARRYTTAGTVARFVGEGPHVDAGSPAQHADRFAAPVYLTHGTLDLNVSVNQSRLMARRLRDAGKTVTYEEIDGLDHYLDDSNVRRDMLASIDQFLTQALGE